MSRESAPDIIAASIRQIRQKARVLARSPLTVADLIEDSPVGGLQYRVFVLAALSLVVDGFDTQAVAYVAPVISKDWSLATGAFGPVFAAGLIGSALGSIALAPWAVFMTHAFTAVIHDARFAGFAKPHRIAFETLPVLSELPVTKTQNAS